MWRGIQVVQTRSTVTVLMHTEVIILFILSSSQSAVTCLQWPAEYIIVFGLAEGKVKKGGQPQERLWVGVIVPEGEMWLLCRRVTLCTGGCVQGDNTEGPVFRSGFLFPYDLGETESTLTRLASILPFSGAFSKH